MRVKKRMIAAALVAVGALASGIAFAEEAMVMVSLSGENEVPPVKTSASGDGMFTITDDGKISGSITTKGIQGTMAHIHHGAAGKNGPVVVKLEKSGNTYTVPAGTKLDADQMKAYKAGELYVNVHSAENKGGEIRGQLK